MRVIFRRSGDLVKCSMTSVSPRVNFVNALPVNAHRCANNCWALNGGRGEWWGWDMVSSTYVMCHRILKIKNEMLCIKTLGQKLGVFVLLLDRVC